MVIINMDEIINKKEDVNFNVSARAARLIGRENVASAEGAIIELVKNTYDADSDFCIIYFDIPYQDAPDYLNDRDFYFVNHKFQRFNIDLNDYYVLSDDFLWHKKIFEENQQKGIESVSSKLDRIFNSLTHIYIIDNGEGMNSETIKKHWMTIGTADKVNNYISQKKRTKSGAKGIGRFALDRLGETCQMWTQRQGYTGVDWIVDWETFDHQNKTINDIKATIQYKNIDLSDKLQSLLSDKQFNIFSNNLASRRSPIDVKSNLTSGTTIQISYIRDDWDKSALTKLRDGLETLVPPSEDDTFQIFLFNNRYENLDGILLPVLCDNFDYKLKANVTNGYVNIELIRNEFQLDKIPIDCLSKYFSNNLVYNINSIEELSKLLPGSSDNKHIDLPLIGDFSFTLYFLKRSSSSGDKQKYYQKDFDYTERKAWLENNSGIKIFRDFFRVRPYGESDSTSWDWLGLGSRVALDPAQASRKGRWKVSPQNISGIINISRIKNPSLEDKSNREGLQENDTFSQFKELLLAIIKIFEDDRSEIYSKLDLYFRNNQEIPESQDLSKKEQEKANLIAHKKFKEFKEKQENAEKIDKSDEELLSLSLLKEQAEKEDLSRELTDMREENALLRVFASSGITIASFAHELRNLELKLGGDRYDFIKTILQKYIDPNSFTKDDELENPYYLLELVEKDDFKMKSWLLYTLRTIKKDKRTRKLINIIEYLDELKQSWLSMLNERDISLNIIKNIESYSIKAFEIDFDCIFNNLIINSREAFTRPNCKNRVINIEVIQTTSGLSILYSDEGPGLSKDIKNPYDIFKATVSTKINRHGKQVGTGLGMWLIKKTLDEYKATVHLNNTDDGFGVEINFPEIK